MKKLIILFMLITSICNAQSNRYGMTLEQGVNGAYNLKDAKRICPLVEGGCDNLPEDVYEKWRGYVPQNIKESDYNQCKTLKFVYKTYSTHTLDIEVDIPTNGKAPYPFIIWVHGGAWANGSTKAFEDQSKYLASRGIGGVRLAYSVKSQGGEFGMGMDELAKALEFTQKHAEQWQFDMKRYGYAGGSAGTPLSSLAAMKQGNKGCKLYIGCNGMYDFLANRQGGFVGGNPINNTYLKNVSDFGAISAINCIQDNPDHIPAVALFHGTVDYTINIAQARNFRDVINRKGGTAILYEYPYYVHAFFNKNKSDMFEDVTIKMYEFAKKHLK